MITIEKIIDPVLGLIVTSIILYFRNQILKKIKRIRFIKYLLKNRSNKTKFETYSISKSDLQTINEIHSNQVRISGPYSNEPKIKCLGFFEDYTESVEKKSNDYKAIFPERNTPNDLHAFITEEINLQDDPIHLETKIADYSLIKAIRDEKPSNQWPRILSASALVVDKDSETIILHRRSEKSATYKKHLHTIGGAYWPSTKDRDGDKMSIINTVYREVLEEINTPISIGNNTPLFLIEELNTGFVQFLFIGCNVHATHRLKGNAEGNHTQRSIEEIENLLSGEEKIVPSGEAAILLWLAMGAPGLERDSEFSESQSKEIFKKISQQRKAQKQKPDLPVPEHA